MTTSLPERLLNIMMSAALRSPLHFIASKQVLLISVKGRKSGRTITTPVSYSREDNRVTIFSRGSWVKNLTGGAPVSLCIQGNDYQGFATPVSSDHQAKAEGLFHHLSIVRGDAKYYGVTFEPDGRPNRKQIETAAEKNTMICVEINDIEY